KERTGELYFDRHQKAMLIFPIINTGESTSWKKITRMLNKDEQTVYYVISRPAPDDFPFGDIKKEKLVKIIT
ncbi:MAG: hypothetical protein GY718_10600, partial [Lentisphaerae bacterium]|nr:hypothetical protein [Lentisphaerota bacterium]